MSQRKGKKDAIMSFKSAILITQNIFFLSFFHVYGRLMEVFLFICNNNKYKNKTILNNTEGYITKTKNIKLK